MKTYTQQELQTILELHLKWLRNEQGGSRADLYNANLYNANLSGANLYNANLRGADLRGADLRSANLSCADLRSADLSGANLYNADLRNANLRGADLRGADLRGAYLYNADLRSADLSDAYLSGAVKIPMYCKWTHGITDGMIHIGCEKRSIEEWDKFFASDEVISTQRDTQEFKQIHAIFNAYKAYLETFKQEEQ